MSRSAPTLPAWDRVTALFGGTFDPPHLGHREAVRGLFSNPGAKRVIILPSATPPLKPNFTSIEHRLEMTRLTFSSTLSDPFPKEVEIDLSEVTRSRDGRPSYSFDTLSEMRSNHPALAFVIGADQMQNLPRWHRFPELLDLCHWIVLTRKPDGEKAIHRALADWQASGLVKGHTMTDSNLWTLRSGTTFLKVVSTQAPQLSSTEIRETIALKGTPPAQSLLPEVMAYLKLHRIYGTR